MPGYMERGARVSERWSSGRSVPVELPDFNRERRESPMTEDRMALAELLQKSGEGDFLRTVAEAVLQILMEADVEADRGRAPRALDRPAQLQERLSRSHARHAAGLAPAA